MPDDMIFDTGYTDTPSDAGFTSLDYGFDNQMSDPSDLFSGSGNGGQSNVFADTIPSDQSVFGSGSQPDSIFGSSVPQGNGAIQQQPGRVSQSSSPSFGSLINSFFGGNVPAGQQGISANRNGGIFSNPTFNPFGQTQVQSTRPNGYLAGPAPSNLSTYLLFGGFIIAAIMILK